MQIKKRLWFNTIISLGMVLLMLLALVWSFLEIIGADRNIKLADEMRTIAFERILLRDEYLLYQEARAKTQWHAKSEALRDLLDMADTRFDHNEDKVLLEDARKDFDATFAGFSLVMEDRARQTPDTNTKPAFSDVESQLISQTFLKAYSLTDNINRLHESAHKTAASVRNRGALIAVIFILSGIIAIIINSAVISRTLTKRISALGKGVEIIGSGDLDHRIPVVGDDELSTLALASNEMAAKLRESYTSVDNMQKEIAQRKRAEEIINRNYQIQNVLNSLLKVSLEGIPLKELLVKALDIVLSVPFLPLMPKGGIFIVEDEPATLIRSFCRAKR